MPKFCNGGLQIHNICCNFPQDYKFSGAGDASGITVTQWEAAVDFWEHLGYTVSPRPFGTR